MSTTSGISVGGLVSGLDTNSIVDQLSSLEQEKVTAVQKKQDQAQLRLTTLGSLRGMLSTLSTKSKDLSKVDSFSMFKATSSDENIATISGSGEGIQGNIGVNVRQLATSWKIASKGFSDSTSSLAAAGTLSISKSAAALKLDPSSTSVDIKINNGDTLKDVASRINAATGAGVTATVVSFGTGDTRLMLNGVDEGGSSFTMTESSGSNVISALGLTKSSSSATSSFAMTLLAGGYATSSSTLGELDNGGGTTNLDPADTFSLGWNVAGSTGTATISAADFTDSLTSLPKTDLTQVTVGEIASFMTTKMGVPITVNASGNLVTTDASGRAIDFTLAMGSDAIGSIPLGGSTASSATTTTAASDFNLRLVTGGPATRASTLDTLFTGIGTNNLLDSDSLSFDWNTGSGSGAVTISADSFTDSTTNDPKTKWSQVSVGELASYMSTQMGVSVTVDSSGKFVATDPNGSPIGFNLGMSSGAAGTIPMGGSSSRTTWANVLQEGQDAFYTMNGLSLTSKSNSDSTTLNGAVISLHTVSDDAVTQTQLTLNRDNTGIQKKVQDFLDSYNAAIKFIDDKSKSTVTSSKDANGLTQNKVTPGELTFDSSASGIKAQLRTMITSQVPGLSAKTKFDSLASLGITTDKDSGGLTIDDKKFQNALAADFDGVRRLFANSGWTDNGEATVGGWTDSTKAGTYALTPSTDVIDGKSGNRIGDILFSQSGNSKGLGVTAPTTVVGDVNATFSRGVAGQLQQYITNLTAFDGSFKSNTDSVQKQIETYGKDATKVQDRVDTYRKSLQAQFTAMESAMMKIKNQSSAFMAQIGG